MARRIVVYRDIPLLGQEVPGGFFLGPLYIWITALIGSFFNINPFVFGFLAALLGVVTSYLIIIIGKNLFSPSVGLISGFLWGSSFLVSFFNQIWWPLVFTPLVVLATYFCLLKIHSGKYLALIPLSLVLALGIQSDPATMSLIIASILLLIFWKIRTKKLLIISITLFIFSHIPLLIFDLTHNFQNLKGLFDLLFNIKPPSSSISITFDFVYIFEPLIKALNTWTDLILPQGYTDRAYIITWCKEYLPLKTSVLNIIPIIFLVIVISAGIRRTARLKYHTALQIVLTHLVVALIGIYIYHFLLPGYLYIWFFYVTFPGLILLISLGISQLINHKSKIFSILALLSIIVILWINLKLVFILPNSNSLGKKNQAINFAISKTHGSREVNIISLGQCLAWSGYRYLYIQNGILPASSYLDQQFGSWLFPQELNFETPIQWQIVFIDHEIQPLSPDSQLIYQEALLKASKKARFGNVEVLIIPIDFAD